MMQPSNSTRARGEKPIRWTLGNTSVPLLFEAWGSPVRITLEKLEHVDKLLEARDVNEEASQTLSELLDKKEELVQRRNYEVMDPVLDRLLEVLGESDFVPTNVHEEHNNEIQRFLDRSDVCQRNTRKIDGIEDYIGWGVVEPEKGQWDWTVYQETARMIRSQGYQYVPYIWIQTLPKWVLHNPEFEFASLVENGVPTEMLAIHSPKTHAAYDRFFGEMKNALGDSIGLLRVGSPYDYGETAYPGQAAQWAFPMSNPLPGFWVHDSSARAHFLRTMAERYGSIESVNRAWHTAYSSYEELDYPKDAGASRYWLDFVNWYHDSFTEMMGLLLAIAKKHFQKTPTAVNLGWPFEKVNHGQDLTGLVKMARQEGVIIRCPTGPMVPFLYTKRVATAAHFYGLSEFSSEPIDGNAKPDEIAMALFKDLTTAVTWHFDYLGNLERSPEYYAHFAELLPLPYPEVDIAFFFSTASHRLENWNRWRDGFMAGGYPEGVVSFVEGLREIMDFDVVDERLIRDGALAHYRSVVWTHGPHVESDVLDKLMEWVEQGGVLLSEDWNSIKVLGETNEWRAPSLEFCMGVVPVGKGFVFSAGAQLDRILSLITHRAALCDAGIPSIARLSALPPIDTVADGVLTSLFRNGLLMFNKTTSSVSKKIPTLTNHDWSVRYAILPSCVELSPLEIKWIDASTGKTDERL